MVSLKSVLARVRPVTHIPAADSPYKLLLSIMGTLVPFFQYCKAHAVLCDVACKTINSMTGYLLYDRAGHSTVCEPEMSYTQPTAALRLCTWDCPKS